MTKAFIGIDPGVSGACALISEKMDGVFDWASEADTVRNLKSWSAAFDIVGAGLERVQTFGGKKGERYTASAKMMQNFGAWRGILTALGIPFTEYAPQTWQGFLKPYAEPGDKDTKARSLRAARYHHPGLNLNLKKHHNRADALNLARYVRNCQRLLERNMNR